MAEEYSKEQLWKLYDKLPEELKEAIFSEETAKSIWEICLNNGIEDERISNLASYVGQVLSGLLPPDEFQETLKKELKLNEKVAKKVGQEVNSFVFYPVRPVLEKLYGKEISPPAKPSWIAPPPQEKPPAPSKEDVYRETLE